MTETRWVEPEAALVEGEGAGGGVLAEEQIAHWRERGFLLVDGVVPGPLVAALESEADATFPPPGEEAAAHFQGFGGHGRLEFPASDALNRVTLHPRLLGAVASLLGTPVSDLRLTQSEVWPKYGRARGSPDPHDRTEQRIHVDYPNHTLLHPPRWDRPEAVEAILYLSDVGICGGPTALVPRAGRDDPAYPWPIVATPGVAGLPYIDDRESAERHLEREAPEVAKFRAEHLYPREVRVRYRVGTLLLYRHDVWHRGTPLEPGTRRLAQNLTFRRAASEWISTLHVGWAWSQYAPDQALLRLIVQSSVEQRAVLGFPPPGHPYWNSETLQAVAARYAPLGLDLAPYQRALGEAS